MDSYAPCPCGSGKKVKFCCQAILPDMARIEHFQENNQPRMALQLIDKLLKSNPDHAWLVDQKAIALLQEERVEEARDALVGLLRKSPDHPLSNALLALAMTELEPVSSCKKVIHRAFLKSMTTEPRLCGLLAEKLTAYYYEEEQIVAARQHLAVTLRCQNEEDREQTLNAMIDLDSDRRVPYPLRGGHPLPQYEAPDDSSDQYRKAQRLYKHACFSEAADQLEQIAAKDSQSAELWHLLGLMRAFDGDEKRAAEALHRSAELQSDFDKAVHVETLAQLLEERLPEEMAALEQRHFKVESVSRLLTRIDNDDRMIRPKFGGEGYDSSEFGGIDIVILDRPLPPESELSELNWESVPRRLGALFVPNEVPDEPTVASVAVPPWSKLDQTMAIIQEVAGDLLTATEAPEETPSRSLLPKNQLPLINPLYLPPGMPSGLKNKLNRQYIEKCVDEFWMDGPQPALKGKCPREAMGDDSLKVPLAAAVRRLDAYLDQQNAMLDQEDLSARLQLPVPERITLQEEDDVNTLSINQMLRLDLSSLSPKTFRKLMQRTLVIQHGMLLHRVLSEFLNNRPDLIEENPEEAGRAYLKMAELHVMVGQMDESRAWLDKGLPHVKANSSFDTLLRWRMTELRIRSRDVDSPDVKELLLELWNEYASKVPQLRNSLQEFVQVLQIPAPWDSSVVIADVASGEGRPIWSSQSEAPAGGEKKLWLPD